MTQNMIDLNRDWSDGAAQRGTFQTHLEEETFAETTNDFDHRTHIHLCPHTVPHFDLPWSLAGIENFFGSKVEHEDNIVSDITLAERFKNRLLPTVLLDFTTKRDHICSIAKEIVYDYDSLTSNPCGGLLDPLKVTKDIFLQLLRDLHIQVSDLITIAEQNNKSPEELFKGRFVLLNSGWIEAFNLPDLNLSSHFFECLHLFLLHPFIGMKECNFLIEHKVLGVGIDAGTVDNPLYFADEHSSLEPVREAKAEMLQVFPVTVDDLEQDRDIRRHNLFREPVRSLPLKTQHILHLYKTVKELEKNPTIDFPSTYPPAHVQFLKNHLLLGEQFSIRSEQAKQVYGGKTCAVGNLVILPFDLFSVTDAIIGIFYFQTGV